MTTTRTRLIAPAVALTSAVLLTTAAPALAKSGDKVASGACQGVAHWKLKAVPENGRIEVEAEVDSNRSGQTWRWSLTHNGSAAGSGTATTAGSSGSFTVRRVTSNLAGTDAFVFNARRPGTQQICRGTLRF